MRAGRQNRRSLRPYVTAWLSLGLTSCVWVYGIGSRFVGRHLQHLESVSSLRQWGLTQRSSR